ncbi:MAG TPA: Sec-independent protein translocase protein TatB [Burkholderiales bacterium]
MFDIGFSELVVIALVGLIVLGPKRLPEVARTLGHWLGRVRRFVADVKQDIDKEMQLAELAELRNLKRELDETRRMVEETSGKLLQEANIAAAAEQATTAAAQAQTPAAPPSDPAPELSIADLPPLTEPPRERKRPAKRRKKDAEAAPKPESQHDGAQ